MRLLDAGGRAAVQEWLLHGTRSHGRHEECVRCGLGRVSVTEWHSPGNRPKTLGAPWRVVQALRRNRSREPVPVFYVGVATAGAVVGLTLDALTGFPWWVAPVVAVGGAWLSFASSALRRGPGSRLGVELRTAVRPGRATELHDAETETVFRTATLPLLGLPEEWQGDRWLGGFETANGRVTRAELGHSREVGERQGELVVGVHAVAGDEPSELELILHITASELARRLGRVAPWPPPDDEPPWPDPRRWPGITVPVDGSPAVLGTLSEGDRWVAVGTVGDRVVSLDADRFPIADVSLTTVADLDPYVLGHRERRQRIMEAWRPD